MSRAWHLLTGEYPPASGGVGDYTRLLARGLADAGREVHIWAPAADADEGSVRVHRVGGFGRGGLRRLGEALDRHPTPRTLLVQYAPRAFGMRGMNVGFCRWVLSRSRAGDDVRAMFHEPYLPFTARPDLALTALANRLMAATLLRASSTAYVSIPAWAVLLRPWTPRGVPFQWLPIPSTIPVRDDPAAVAAVRARVIGDRPDRLIVGHFGTYGGLVAPLLGPALRAVLEEEPRAVALLLGRGGEAYADALARESPALRDRLVAPGFLSPDEMSIHLQACDVMLQPYPDGASARRTTLMAALSHGVATATNIGQFSEHVWADGPVPVSPTGDAAALAREVVALLGDVNRRRTAGEAGRAFYERHFSLRRTLDVLLTEDALATAGRSPG